MRSVFGSIGYGLLVLCSFSLPLDAAGNWYRGNLHSHTNYSDGSDTPLALATWYRDNGYDFLSITDHNRFDPAEAATLTNTLSQGRRSSFLVIPGEEITDTSADNLVVHMTAWNPSALVIPQGGATHGETIRRDTAATLALGGVPSLAHPYYDNTPASELTAVPNLQLFEVNNPAATGPADVLWDQVLSLGKKMYGIGVDDTHSIAPNQWASAGRSWVVVRSPSLSTRQILNSLLAGDFYASTGVNLADVQTNRRNYAVVISAAPGKSYRTDFIGKNGAVLFSSTSLSPTYFFNGSELYVRAKVYENETGFVAWTQPYFR